MFVVRPMESPAIVAPRFPVAITFNSRSGAAGSENVSKLSIRRSGRRSKLVLVSALGDRSNSSTGGDGNSNSKGKAASSVPSSNYVVPLDNPSSSCITRPLAEILRDLNKRIPDNIIVKYPDSIQAASIPWYISIHSLKLSPSTNFCIYLPLSSFNLISFWRSENVL